MDVSSEQRPVQGRATDGVLSAARRGPADRGANHALRRRRDGAAHRSRNLAAPRLDARRRARLDRPARIVRAGAARRNGAGGWRARQSCARVAGARDGCRRCDRGRSRLGHPGPSPARSSCTRTTAGVVGDWIRKLQDNLGAPIPAHPSDEPAMPNILEVLASSLNIMQVRIARSRMAGEPPDVIVAPRLAHLRLLDFHRAKEAIEEGRRAVERVAHAMPWSAPQSACERVRVLQRTRTFELQ